MHVAAPVHVSTVRDQIHLHAPGRRLIPVGKSSHRDPTADFRRHSAELPRARGVARRAEQPVDRCGAHREHLGSD
jgi:hypothetical protein